MFDRWARWYDAIYRARGKDFDAEARAVTALCRRHGRRDSLVPGAAARPRLLDVACGTGAHLRVFAEVFAVEGLDRCAAMLDVARAAVPGAPLHHADMRSFALGTRFDAITCLFGSVGYLPEEEDLSAFLDAAVGHLHRGAVLVIESPPALERLAPATRQSMTIEVDGVRIHRDADAAFDGQVLRITFRYVIGAPPDGTRFEEVHAIRIRSDAALRAAVRHAGLRVCRLEVASNGTSRLVARLA
ncbi:MAG: class I SAM-dependent methyltransferase [Phycisphaeraceae bacterium]|nr:class I SAM-dependent methyltransferase [Phycisphaeraceae bacterium]